MTLEIRELIVQATVRDDLTPRAGGSDPQRDEELLIEKIKQQITDWLCENRGIL